METRAGWEVTLGLSPDWNVFVPYVVNFWKIRVGFLK